MAYASGGTGLFRTMSAAVAALGLAAAAQASDPPTPQPQSGAQAANTAKKPDNRAPLICREVTEVGSRIPRQRCRPQSEWDRIDQSGGFTALVGNPALAAPYHY